MIAVTFFQTLGLLLDLDVTWPEDLRRWMSFFNLLNVNLQIARPECSARSVSRNDWRSRCPTAREWLCFSVCMLRCSTACLNE